MRDHIYFGERSGVLDPRYSGSTATVVKMLILGCGDFTAHDQWEKAERHGWRVVKCALTQVRPSSSPAPEKQEGETR